MTEDDTLVKAYKVQRLVTTTFVSFKDASKNRSNFLCTWVLMRTLLQYN